MAGHNKWSKVKQIKARVDAIKGRVFSKCAHEIALAARAGGGDLAANARLRTAIDNAKAVCMPKETIDRAIKKGTGELGSEMIQKKLISIPQTPCVVDDLTLARQVLKLYDLLDDDPDTLNVFTNFEVADELLEALAS